MPESSCLHYLWPVLLRCLASSTAAASHSRPLWRLLCFSTGQRCCPQGAWDRAAVNLWNIRLHRSSSVASQQSWPEPGRLPDVGKPQERVYRVRIHDVDQLKSCLIEELEHFHQVFIDVHWSGSEFTSSRLSVLRYVCAVAYSGHFCFGVTSLNPL